MFAWQATVQDEAGNAVPLPVVTVYEDDGATLADIYGEDGSPLENPFTGTMEGFVQFWADSGGYKVVGASGGNPTEAWNVWLGGDITYPDYESALEAIKPSWANTVRAIVDGRIVEWVRVEGGEALGGGWGPSGTVIPMHFGVDSTGSLDVTDSLAQFLSYGGDLYIPSGRYFIARRGEDNGGVVAVARRSTSVVADSDAVFFTDDLDNDMVRIVASSDTPDGIKIEWDGGFFDQRNQRNSTSMPSMSQYPPVNPGTSATCDGLHINGTYTVSGIDVCKVSFASVSRVRTYAGDHWQNAGGDSGIMIAGCKVMVAFRNETTGNRDLGIYISGPNTTAFRSSVRVENNVHNACFFGSAAKRSVQGVLFSGNHSINCIRAHTVELPIGGKTKDVVVTSNTATQCSTLFRCDDTYAVTVADNTLDSLGSVLSDSSTVVSSHPIIGIEVRGTEFGNVSNNKIVGLTAGATSARPGECILLRADGGTSEVSFSNNTGVSLRSVGVDLGLRNSFIYNIVYNYIVSPNMTIMGSSSYEIRRGIDDSVPHFMGGVRFSDGDRDVCSISRGSQGNTGLRFAANSVYLVTSGIDRVSAGQTGVAFNGNAPINRPILPPAATDTVSAMDLVNSLRSALIDYGLAR